MSALSLLLNLAAYSAQLVCLVATAALVPTLLRIDVPAVRYAYWRAVLAVALVLPWIQGRTMPAARVAVTNGTIDIATGSAATAASVGHATAFTLSWPRLLLGLLVAGAALRVIWIASGLFRLRRLRRDGAPLDLTPIDDAFRRSLAPHASVREVSGLRQPVTFGWRHPIVLVPDRLRGCQPAVREAVLCHEFHHVDRRDWPWVLLEQIITSLLWFHPAMWWLVSRVQLAREEVVDDLVVRTTGTRKTYIEALLAFADGASRIPVAAFARRRHLFGRIQLIAKERVMSVPRLAFSSVLLTVVTIGTVWYASQLFPLSAGGLPQQVTAVPGPMERSARTLTQAQLPKIVSAPANPTPPEMVIVNASGAVVVKLTVDQNGNVAEARPIGFAIGGPGLTYRAVSQDPLPSLDLVVAASDPLHDAVDALVRSTASSATQWTFEPPGNAPVSFYATISSGSTTSTRATMLLSATNPPIPARDPSVLAQSGGPGIGALGVAGGVATQASGRGGAGTRGGQAGPSRGTLAAGTPTPSFTAPRPPPPPPPPAPQGRVVDAIRVGGNIPAPKKIKDVKPVYPAIAQSARVQGIVIIEATIDVDGSVADTQILRSIPLLDQAAIDAVRQWRFVPTLLNGQPTPIIMSVTVNFQLGPPPGADPQQ
jgi:TonB family protein